MDITTLRVLATLVSFVTFIGIAAWAWSARRQAGFDEAARLPLAPEDGS